MVRDLHTLKYSYTLDEVLKIKEYVDIASAVETANHKDQEAESKRASNKR